MKLFAIYIGGEHPAAHIEIHDVRFIVARSLKATHDALRRQWWGTPGTLHIDCWAEIDHVDGFDVQLRPDPYKGRERLFFVNLGGYDPADFAEQHRNMFVVAENVTQAKVRAMATIPAWKEGHRDDLYEAEKAFALNEVVGEKLHIHLVATQTARPPKFACRYTPLR